MAERPAKAIATVLQAAAALSGETVRVGMPSDDLERGVWCSAAGGPAEIPILGSSGETIIQARVQVIVRTKRREHEACETLAWAVHDALKRASPTDYTRCHPAGPPIQFLEPETQRPVGSVNVDLTLIE